MIDPDCLIRFWCGVHSIGSVFSTMLAELAALKLKAGESIEMVANCIKEHLVIVLINKNGEDLLDIEFGLKGELTQ